MMPVVYSLATGRIRRITLLSPGERVTPILQKGEALIDLELDHLETMQQALNKQTGQAISFLEPNQPDRYVLVDDTGLVTGAVFLDPQADAITDATMKLSPIADIGWTLDAKADVLVAPIPAVMPKLITPIVEPPIEAVPVDGAVK